MMIAFIRANYPTSRGVATQTLCCEAECAEVANGVRGAPTSAPVGAEESTGNTSLLAARYLELRAKRAELESAIESINGGLDELFDALSPADRDLVNAIAKRVRQ